jgi:hypothetical protein
MDRNGDIMNQTSSKSPETEVVEVMTMAIALPL